MACRQSPRPSVAIAPESPDARPKPKRPPGLPTEAELLADVTWLASPELRGREAGTEDERRAADWVAERFRALELETSFQEFEYRHDGASRRSRNVLGWLRGSAPDAGDRYLMIGAHVDHLGVRGGEIYAGADDDASGIAAMLAVAAAWSSAPDAERPRHDVLFVAFGAEEPAPYVQGSTHLAANPPRPLDQLIVMINLDMVGRSPFMGAAAAVLGKRLAGIPPGPGVGVLDSPAHPALLVAARAAAGAVGLPLHAPADFPRLAPYIRAQAEDRGDQKAFKDRGLPFLFFSTSLHDDYHLPSDTADKIDGAVLRQVADVVWRTAAELDRTP